MIGDGLKIHLYILTLKKFQRTILNRNKLIDKYDRIYLAYGKNSKNFQLTDTTGAHKLTTARALWLSVIRDKRLNRQRLIKRKKIET